jgi:hypothetical protein
MSNKYYGGKLVISQAPSDETVDQIVQLVNVKNVGSAPHPDDVDTPCPTGACSNPYAYKDAFINDMMARDAEHDRQGKGMRELENQLTQKSIDLYKTRIANGQSRLRDLHNVLAQSVDDDVDCKTILANYAQAFTRLINEEEP